MASTRTLVNNNKKSTMTTKQLLTLLSMTLASVQGLCDLPGSPMGGHYRTVKAPNRHLTRIHYYCHDGYHLYGGSEYRECEKKSGEWAGETPECITDVALNKPTYFSSSTVADSASWKSSPVSGRQALKHEGNTTGKKYHNISWKWDVRASFTQCNVTHDLRTEVLFYLFS